MNTYLQTLRRRKALILLIVVLMPVAAYVATQRQPDRYRSSTQVLLQRSGSIDDLVSGAGPSNTDPVAQERFLQTQADLGQVPEVAQNALARAHVSGITPDRLLDDVEVKPKPNTDLLVISTTASTATLARRLTMGTPRRSPIARTALNRPRSHRRCETCKPASTGNSPVSSAFVRELLRAATTSPSRRSIMGSTTS